MRSRLDVFYYDALEIAAGDALEVEENVIALACQALEYRQRPRRICTAVAYENGFLDVSHVRLLPLACEE